ncbi:hypothetical protein ACOSQ2_022948 [Xanthoceras sorbifolium]
MLGSAASFPSTGGDGCSSLQSELVNEQCTSGSCTKTPFGRQVDSTGEFRDQNRSSIRSFFRADFRRSELRLGEREPEREISLIPAGNTLTYS